MQNEDDLRGLAKVTDFMRAVSFLFLAIHIYWFCYGWLHEMGWTLDIVDRILSNFQRTTGLFSSLLYTKLFCVLFLGLSCMGNQGVKKLSLIHISEPTRQAEISYAVFCLKKKKKKQSTR